MKKFSFRVFFVVLLVVASISAQIFVSGQSAIQYNAVHVEQHLDADSVDAPHIQLDIEILKSIIRQGKSHLPVISNTPDL